MYKLTELLQTFELLIESVTSKLAAIDTPSLIIVRIISIIIGTLLF